MCLDKSGFKKVGFNCDAWGVTGTQITEISLKDVVQSVALITPVTTVDVRVDGNLALLSSKDDCLAGSLWSVSHEPLPEFPLCNLSIVVSCFRIVVNAAVLVSEAVDFSLPSGDLLQIKSKVAFQQDGNQRMKLVFVSLGFETHWDHKMDV